MAGSLNWFRYTDDTGNSFSVKLDESNSKATVGGVQLFLNRTIVHPLLAKGFRMRYVNATLVSNPAIKRRFWVGNPLALAQVAVGGAFLAGVYPVAGDTAVTPVPWSITSVRGEQARLAPSLNTTGGDTGLTDGTVPQDA
jgi:hypothetical protein